MIIGINYKNKVVFIKTKKGIQSIFFISKKSLKLFEINFTR